MQSANRRVLAFFGLKHNPFHSDIPIGALYRPNHLKSFLWRIENLVMDGGMAGIYGDSGLGKSSILRLTEKHLAELPEVNISLLKRPQSSVVDFYRELCDLFQVEIKMSNRWGGYKSLREKWLRHIDTTLFRPVLIIDEAQYMKIDVLSELRMLSSDKLDSRKILTIILAGDHRLTAKLDSNDLIPIKNRIRTKLKLLPYNKEELIALMHHAVEAAGNKQLVSEGLIAALAEHSLGNPRVMMNTADELLSAAALKERNILDESLYFEVFQSSLDAVKSTRRKS